MIRGFKDKRAESIWRQETVKNISLELQQMALRKMRMLNNAKTVQDLRVPPANHLEKLLGDRKNTYSIRINKQWRLCFMFEDGEATNIEIVDYH